MGRLSKFIASKVRLRFPSWKAWAFVSIALCPAFAGADRATAEAGAPPLTTNLNLPHPPTNLNVPHTLPSSLNLTHTLPSSLNLTHTLPSSMVQPTAPSRFQMKFNNDAIPGGAGASPNAISRPDLHHILGGAAINGGGKPALPGGGGVYPLQAAARVYPLKGDREPMHPYPEPMHPYPMAAIRCVDATHIQPAIRYAASEAPCGFDVV